MTDRQMSLKRLKLVPNTLLLILQGNGEWLRPHDRYSMWMMEDGSLESSTFLGGTDEICYRIENYEWKWEC